MGTSAACSSGSARRLELNCQPKLFGPFYIGHSLTPKSASTCDCSAATCASSCSSRLGSGWGKASFLRFLFLAGSLPDGTAVQHVVMRAVLLRQRLVQIVSLGVGVPVTLPFVDERPA